MQLQLIFQALLVGFVSASPNPQPANPSIRNDVTTSQPCLPNILLYARAHVEPGNIGSAIGQSFIRSIEDLAPARFLYQGIDYMPSVPHLDGSLVAQRQLKDAVTLCPGARIFLGGYSQGARLWHQAWEGTVVDRPKIEGIVTFGDPLRIHPFIGIDSSKVKSFCATADNVCGGTSPYPVITAAHLMYANSGDTTRGAKFVAGLAA